MANRKASSSSSSNDNNSASSVSHTQTRPHPDASAATTKTPTTTMPDPQQHVSKIPRLLRFPLILLLSLTLSSLLYSLVPTEVAADLARVSRSLDQWWQVALLVGWRAVELALLWFSGGDAWDGAAVVIAGRGPTLYLLHAFYALTPRSVGISMSIDILTIYVPFRLLRPISAAHTSLLHRSAVTKAVVPNQAVLTDLQTTLATTLLPAAIYATALHIAFASYLPVHLVTEFDTLSSIEVVYTKTYITLLPVALLAGYAARVFVFVPAVATPSASSSSKAANGQQPVAFDAAAASLCETIRYNFWGWSQRTKTVITRTASLVLVSGVGTFVQCWVTVEGVSVVGAAGWAAIWELTAVAVGFSLGVCASV